jgi:hypothetical protein
MEFQAVQFAVDKIISLIRTGRLALPDFQRDFVWNPARVVELLDSVSRQWPIGSLLFLNGPQEFGIRSIESAPPVASQLSTYVLDGQQRLTALYHAVADVSDICYFVDFSALSRDEDEYIKWQKRSSFEKNYKKTRDRAEQSIALISDIWENDKFFEWIEAINDQLVQRSYVMHRERYLSGLKSHVYKLMVIQLDQDIAKGALARIFETINRSGVRLNAFDLLVAILHPMGFNLRNSWEEAKSSSELFDYFDVDPIELLKLVALLIRSHEGRSASKGVRQGDLLNLDGAHIRQYWPIAVDLYRQALDYGRKNLGICSPGAVPSWSLILGVAAWLSIGTKNNWDVTNWFWFSCFLQTYAQGANTKIVSDFDNIVSGGENWVWSENIGQEIIEIFDEPARRNGLALRGFACGLVNLGALDLVSGEVMQDKQELTYWVQKEFGILKRLQATEHLSAVLVCSETSAKKLNKNQGSLLSCGVSKADVVHRLQSQFFSDKDNSRSETDLSSFFLGLTGKGIDL